MTQPKDVPPEKPLGNSPAAFFTRRRPSLAVKSSPSAPFRDNPLSPSPLASYLLDLIALAVALAAVPTAEAPA